MYATRVRRPQVDTYDHRFPAPEPVPQPVHQPADFWTVLLCQRLVVELGHLRLAVNVYGVFLLLSRSRNDDHGRSNKAIM